MLILILLLSSCQEKKLSDNKAEQETTAPLSSTKHEDNLTLENLEFFKAEISKNSIMGIWTNGNSENATFRIDEDSILFVEGLENYYYEIKGDSLLIDFKDWISRNKIIKLSQDSMTWAFKDGSEVFWRFNCTDRGNCNV